uniref:Uncharacterized protein n=1 Tax=Arundo donax TaxID=35708 RepID=A0A0A8Z197_ARUDO
MLYKRTSAAMGEKRSCIGSPEGENYYHVFSGWKIGFLFPMFICV